jgi:hypothetical protein
MPTRLADEYLNKETGPGVPKLPADPVQQPEPEPELAPVPSRLADEYIDKSAGMGKADVEGLDVSLRQANETTPEEHTDVLRVSSDTGLPSDVVERNLTEIKQKTGVQRAKESLVKAPLTSKFLSDPNNAKVAHDDIDNMADAEDLMIWGGEGAWFMGMDEALEDLPEFIPPEQQGIFAAAKAGLEMGKANVREGYIGYKIMNSQLPKDKAKLEELQVQLEVIQARQKALGGKPTALGLPRLLYASSEVMAFMTEPLKDPEAGALVAAGGAAGSVIPGVGTVAGMGAGFASHVFRSTQKIETGSFYLDMIEKGHSHEETIIPAHIAGNINGLLELGGLAVVTLPFKKIAKKLVKEAVMDKMEKTTMKEAFKIAGKSYVAQLIAEPTEEVLQDLTKNVTEEYLKTQHPDFGKGEYIPRTPEEVVSDSLKSFWPAMEAMLLLGLPGAGANLQIDLQRADESKRNNKLLQDLAENSNLSKLRERSPELYKRYLAQIKEGKGIDNVHIPAEAWITYYQEKGLDPIEEARKISDEAAEQLIEVAQTGGDFAVPLEAYLSDIALSEHYEALSAAFRLNPEDMTIAEVEEFETVAPDRMAELKEIATEKERVDVMARVTSRIAEELEATGRVPGKAARLQAEALYGSLFKTMGERMGVAPESLAERFGLQVARGEEARPVDEIDILLNQIRTGKVPTDTAVYGPSLLEFIAEQGGIKEEAGELIALGAERWHKDKKFRKRLVTEHGAFLDDMAFNAWEAGYFPQFVERPDINDLLGAIDEELRGDIKYSEQNIDQAAADQRFILEDIEQALEEADIDVLTATPEEVRAVFDEPGLRKFYQPAAPVYGTLLDPSTVATITLPETTIGLLPSKAEKGEYYHATVAQLQSHLDWHGDGFLYRVSAPISIQEGWDIGNPDYMHKFKGDVEAKTYAFMTSMEEAQNYIDNHGKKDYFVYRVSPQDLAEDFAIQIPSDRKGETLHIHSPAPASTSLVDVIYRNEEWIERTPDESHRAIEEWRTEQPRTYRPGRPELRREARPTGRRGVTPDIEGRKLFQTIQAPPFFSQLEKIITEKMPTKASTADVRNLIKKGAVKAEEIKWSGIEEFLSAKKSVTKDEVLVYLRANQIEVVETVKEREGEFDDEGDPSDDLQRINIEIDEDTGEQMIDYELRGNYYTVFFDEDAGNVSVKRDDSEDFLVIDAPINNQDIADAEAAILNDFTILEEEGAVTKFADYTLPGGENYKEMLLRLPEVPGIADISELDKISQELHGRNYADLNTGQPVETSRLRVSVKREFNKRHPGQDALYVETRTLFRGGHFDEPNILAHVRFNERTDSEGNKVLFIEELQSDWALAGRKKGFKTPERKDKIASLKKELSGAEQAYDKWVRSIPVKEFAKMPLSEIQKTPQAQRVSEAKEALLAADEFGGVPSAPLLKNWHELALKRMLRYAAENDFDKVAWITGEQTAERYDLSKQAEEVIWNKTKGSLAIEMPNGEKRVVQDSGVTENTLERFVGKTVADKMLKGEGNGITKKINDEGSEFVFAKGDGLKVGGEWATTLYDKVIPNYLKKYGKKWGAKVGEVNLSADKRKLEIERVGTGWSVKNIDTGESLGIYSFKGQAEAILAGQQMTQQSIPITDAMKESVLELGQPLFQEKRGVFQFTGDLSRSIITLLEKADASTFIHETGHFYLEVLGKLAVTEGAPTDIVQDYQAVLDWLGAKEGERLTTEHHEQWARGFEAYLRKGNAPSVALRKAFAQFRAWLLDVYKTIRGLDVELTPEIEDVFARMIASQADIDIVQLETENALIDLVVEGKDIGKVTDEEISKLVPAYKGVPTAKVKGVVRQTTGLSETVKMIREDKALAAAWLKAEQSARKAFKAGREAETVKWKAKMQDVKAKATAKVAKVMTEKEKMNRRRKQIKAITDYLNLSDGQIKKLMRRQNFTLMTDYEYKKFKDDLLVRAVELQDKSFAKERVAAVIRDKHLQKVENYHKAMQLPAISKMTTDELNQWADTLEAFEDGDIFLGPVQLKTVDNTPLAGIKTWREAKERLATSVSKREGRTVTVEELSNLFPPNVIDMMRYDTALSERDPFFRMLVEETTRAVFNAELIAHDIENELFELARKSEKSRGFSITRKIIPQDKQIMAYLEASEEEKASHAGSMTPEQLDLAHYMMEYFAQAIEYLIKVESLTEGRKNYFVHMRRNVLEDIKEAGFTKAVKNIFKNHEEDQMVFTILDGITGQVLPLNKHFQYAMRRSGNLEPTFNVVRSFLIYMRTLEKKKALDALLPMMDIYAQAISPVEMTKKGLPMDPRIKEFVYKYLNNKKGRRIGFDSVIKQGGKIDIGILALRSWTAILDLGANVAVGLASLVGEAGGNFAMLSASGIARAEIRRQTAKGKVILKKYEAFTNRSFWQEFTAPGKEFTERFIESLFGLFHINTRLMNQQFLLGSITKKELDSGTISEKRLAELRLAMGRFRVVPGAKSIIGSTSLGGAIIQYKSWAVPMLRTSVKDFTTFARDLKDKSVGEALTTREARELYRIVMITVVALMVSAAADQDDNSMLGKIKAKMRREMFSIAQSWDPAMWIAVPRSASFAIDFARNISDLVRLEEYASKPGLKGAERLKQQFTPTVARHLRGG